MGQVVVEMVGTIALGSRQKSMGRRRTSAPGYNLSASLGQCVLASRNSNSSHRARSFSKRANDTITIDAGALLTSRHRTHGRSEISERSDGQVLASNVPQTSAVEFTGRRATRLGAGRRRLRIAPRLDDQS